MERNEDANGEDLRARWIAGLSNAAARRGELDDVPMVELLWAGVQMLRRVQDYEGICSLLDWYQADAALVERTRQYPPVIVARAHLVQAHLMLNRQDEAAEILTSLLDTVNRRERREATLVSRAILMETHTALDDSRPVSDPFVRAVHLLISALRRRVVTTPLTTLGEVRTALRNTYPPDVRARFG